MSGRGSSTVMPGDGNYEIMCTLYLLYTYYLNIKVAVINKSTENKCVFSFATLEEIHIHSRIKTGPSIVTSCI